MRLLRDNTEDPRVMRDLEMLAGAYAEGGADEGNAAVAEAAATAATDAAAGDTMSGGEVDEPREPSPLDDGFVRTFVTVTVHVRRFFPYYVGAAVWVAVMLLMSPADRQGADLASAVQPVTGNFANAGELSAEAQSAEAPPPAFGDIAATPGDASFAFAPPTDSTFASSDASGFSDTASDTSSFDSSAFASTTDTSIVIDDEPEPLRITKSGYSSRTGGTPLEQAPPGDGLPVAAVGGEATKRSFIGLSGDETVLKLALVDDSSNVGVEQAVVRACPITADDWQAARGAAMDAEPAWAEPCIDAVRGDDGVWTFDLSTFGNPGSMAGFALTPGTAAGLSFNLTFAASPVRST